MATDRAQNQRMLRKLDRELVRTLDEKLLCRPRPGQWRNASLRRTRRLCQTPVGLQKVRDRLERAGAFAVPCERRSFVDADGERLTMTLARAASTDMWPMGTHYWVRDNAIIGARYLFSKNRREQKRGKELLVSTLTFMSTEAQRARCVAILTSSSASFRSNPKNWPYIFAGVSSNLATRDPEPWTHAQDAWQIAAFYVLEALEQGLVSLKELSTKHREFLGLIVPFLAKVSFWKSENSGSWEELLARRVSVRAWEHRLIVKIAKLSCERRFSFLRTQYTRWRRHLPATFRSRTLAQAVLLMEESAVAAMVKELPFESPDYRPSDPRYREADAALIYLLLMDYPYFLAARLGVGHEWAHHLERFILATVSRLDDEVSGGIYRYGNDSYQRSGFFRNSTIQGLRELYGAPSGDASKHFVGRDRVVPKGRKAAWTHFVWQLAAWSGRRYLETGAIQYRRLHDAYFMRGMGLFTGSGEVSVDQERNGRARVIRIKALLMPECYISERIPGGKTLVFPSPHTPLNWAVGEMFSAFEIRELVLATTSKDSSKRGKR